MQGLHIVKGCWTNKKGIQYILRLLNNAKWSRQQMEPMPSSPPNSVAGFEVADLTTAEPEVLAQLLSSPMYHMSTDVDLSAVVRLVIQIPIH